MRRKMRTFPSGPLRELLAERARKNLEFGVGYEGARIPKGLRGFCADRGISDRVLYAPRIGEWTVDRICVAVGMHPSEVYEDWHSLADSVEVA